MADLPKTSHKQLMRIFGLTSMADLPAMSDHVQELISLLGNSRATAADLARAIMKDYALTTKILQVVNSAYYLRGVPVTTISRAVTVVGFLALRELATAIGLFEEFVKAGMEKDRVLELFTRNLISATQSKLLVERKRYRRVCAEEAFICTLLHQLGKVVVLVYLPDRYRAVEAAMAKGYSEERATRLALADLTFSLVGQELATYWNFSEKIVLSMKSRPPKPANESDTMAYLQNLAAFNCQLTEVTLGNGTDLDLEELIYRYGPVLAVDRQEAIALVDQAVSTAEELSRPLRKGLGKLQARNRLIRVRKTEDGGWERLS